MGGTAAEPPTGWLRAVALMMATGLFSVVNPGVLVAIPFALLVLFLPSKRLLTVLLAGAALFFATLGGSLTGLWYLERGWALLLGGTFLAITLRWPQGSFLPRGLGAVIGSSLAMALLFRVRPGDWAVVDWAVKSRMEEGMSLALRAVRGRLGPGVVTEAFESRAFEAVALQGLIFPALLGLASLSALGVAWWMFVRLARSRAEGLRALKEFRFNDQLVWILILGLVAVLGSSGLIARFGTNAVVFMGTLYALRGVGVVLFLTGGFSFLGGVLLLVGFLLVAPFFLFGAFLIGLGDTWLDLRTRGGEPSPPPNP